MKLLSLILFALSIAALILWSATAYAADLVVTPQTLQGPTAIVYDEPEGIVFDAVVMDGTPPTQADVTAKAAYEVTLKPGTRIEAGARFVISMKDNDGLPNRWEMGHCTTLTYGPADDPDNDSLMMQAELQNGTNPCGPDSDGDGMPDGWEVSNGLNPTVDDSSWDADGDGLSNIDEFHNGTDPRVADTDGDGMGDGYEVLNELDPRIDDTELDEDEDGVSNIDEHDFGTVANDPASKPRTYNYTFDQNGNLINMQ